MRPEHLKLELRKLKATASYLKEIGFEFEEEIMNIHEYQAKEILAKLNSIAKPADDWLVDAKFRVDNQDGYIQAIAQKLRVRVKVINYTKQLIVEAISVLQQVNKWVKGKRIYNRTILIEAALNGYRILPAGNTLYINCY